MKTKVLEMLNKLREENIEAGNLNFKLLKDETQSKFTRDEAYKNIDRLYERRMQLNDIISEIDDMINPETESFDW